jgi:type II secretory pathway component GspD/PulD (secretin)
MKKFLSLITCFLLISSASAFESYSFPKQKQTEEKTNEKYNLGAKLIEDESKVAENSATSKKEPELLQNQKDLQDKNKTNNENINKAEEHKDKPKTDQKSDQISNFIQERLLMPITININNVTFEYLFNHISNYVKVSIVMKNFESDSSGTTSTTSTTTQIGGNSRILPITVSYYATNKPLKLVLDELCGMYDLTWKIEDYRIVIYRYEEKVFQVKLPILEKSISLNDDALTLKYQKDFYQNLETSLKSLLKDGSSKITINNMGYIAVRARPSEIRIIEQAVNKINKYFTSTIPLRITVLIVRLNNSNTTGLNVFKLKSDNQQAFSFNLSKENNLNLTNVLNLSFAGIFKNWSLEGLFQTLSEYGDVKVLEDLHMRALNYQPLIWKPQKKQRIISNFQLTYMSTAPTGTGTGQTTGNTTTVPQVTTQTEDIDEGSNLIIVPYYLTDDGEQIVVDMYRSQKEILELTNWNVNLGNGNNTIILPKVQTYSDIQQSVVKKGEGIIIVSSTVTQETLRKSGIPFLQNIPIIGYLFGTTTKENDKFQIVITIGYEG